jgi:hypothetical protein
MPEYLSVGRARDSMSDYAWNSQALQGRRTDGKIFKIHRRDTGRRESGESGSGNICHELRSSDVREQREVAGREE